MQMKRALFAVPALAAGLVSAACERMSDPVVCLAVVPPSADVTVVDSLTGANVTSGASLVLRNASAVVDSVTAPTPQAPYTLESMGVGSGRTGTFALTVRQGGYLPWTKTGIRVERGACGAETVHLTARLVPAA
jgi:hypothetical protein